MTKSTLGKATFKIQKIDDEYYLNIDSKIEGKLSIIEFQVKKYIPCSELLSGLIILETSDPAIEIPVVFDSKDNEFANEILEYLSDKDPSQKIAS